MELSGAEIVCESLLQEGVEVVFGLPGGAVLPLYGAPGHDYVLICRGGTAARDFVALGGDLRRALERVQRAGAGCARLGGETSR